MKRIARTGFLSVILLGSVLSCGGSEEGAPVAGPARFLPAGIASSGWHRSQDIGRFAGDSLFEYIDGAAEMYHKYDFVDVNVAGYMRDDDEITADLYRFAGPDMAFGMYTTLRPDDSETVDFGVTGFCFGPSLVFVKGRYMVSLTGYDESEVVTAGLRIIAASVDSLLPGTTELPRMFALLPQSGYLPHTEKVFAESFLGRGFLTDVYTADYGLADDTLTLFVADDQSGQKLLEWSEATPSSERLRDLPYDGDGLAIVDDWHGLIVAGPKRGRLAGIVGYSRNHRDFLAAWFDSFPRLPQQ